MTAAKIKAKCVVSATVSTVRKILNALKPANDFWDWVDWSSFLDKNGAFRQEFP